MCALHKIKKNKILTQSKTDVLPQYVPPLLPQVLWKIDDMSSMHVYCLTCNGVGVGDARDATHLGPTHLGAPPPPTLWYIFF